MAAVLLKSRPFGAFSRGVVDAAPKSTDLTFTALPRPAQIYLIVVMAGAAGALVDSLPPAYPLPPLFVALLILSCLTSSWKVTLPISLASGSTLSMSYAANLMALILLGPRYAVFVSIAGAWMQCTYRVKQRYPMYRTLFSVAAEAITMIVTGVVYAALGGPAAFLGFAEFAKPLVASIATYFVVNTALVAGAIALSTGPPVFSVWRENFLWSGTSFVVAGSAGALAAIVVARGEHWKAILLLAPVHLTYRTYQLFVGRLDDQKQHVAESQRLLETTVNALRQTREAEHALLAERERLATALAEMTRLEEGRHQLLEREQAARTAAEAANRVKDEFLAIVSHELRTPLNAILGWADMLHRGKLDDPGRDLASRAIVRSAKRQAQLIDDLLDVARIMAGKLRLELRAVDLESTVRDAVQLVQADADAKKIAIAVDTEGPIGPVHGDATRLQQIVWNLLTNAIKFTPKGGRVTVKLRQIGARAELAVADTGQGIPPDFLPFVFAPFRQADASMTRLKGGLGLGLSIVKHLVDAHDGTINAESRGDGHGATFTVRLAIDPLFAPESELQAAATHLQPVASLSGISVLVVDDDDESRQIVAAQLQSRGASVVATGSAADAYTVLSRQHVDVLLADIAMPEEDGYALMRRVRSCSRPEMASIPAAALTAFARDEDRARAAQAGFHAHLAKPVDPDVLAAAVANLATVSGARRV